MGGDIVGGRKLRCVAHSTINNGPGGVTGTGMGADVTEDVGGGIVGGRRLRCVAHSTINNGPGGVTGAGMGADVTTDTGDGIVARGCNENAVMTVGHGRTAMVHGVDVVISAVSISNNALD
jgi:hypothetical protein